MRHAVCDSGAVHGADEDTVEPLEAALGSDRARELEAELAPHGLVVISEAELASMQEMAIRYRRLEALVFDPDDDPWSPK